MGYDPWGNRLNQSVTGGSCFSFSAGATTQNRMSGYQYDSAGNLLNDGNHSYTYDAENRVIQVDGGATASYVYNEDGERVRKNTSSGFTEYFYGPNGNVQSEYNGTSWPAQYIYAGSRLIAEYENGSTSFIHGDLLNSTRLVTNVSGAVFDSIDYQPFGEQTAGATGTKHKFTGKERDTESGLDDFGARYYGSHLGRFMTPDWAAKPITVPYASFGDPQTLNLYAYVENGPVNRADADGHAEGLWQSRPTETRGNLYGTLQGLDDPSWDLSLTSGESGFVLVNGQFVPVVGGQLIAQNVEPDPVEVPESMTNERGEIDPNAEAERGLDFEDPLSDWPSGSACPGCFFPGDDGPLDPGHAKNFKWYFRQVLEDPQTYYRQWGPPAGETGAHGGTYYSFFPPEGSEDFMRSQMSLPSKWNSMENTTAKTFPAGTVVYVGPASSQAGYPGGGIQVFVPDAQ